MERQRVRKTYNYKLKPTPEQERFLDHTLMLCPHVYNAAVSERREAWRMRGVSATYYQQKYELPGIKEAMPEYGEVDSQILRDVILRVDRALKAHSRRVKNGETPGYPRFQGRNRYSSLTYPLLGNVERLDNGLLVLCKIGRIAVRWSRPLVSTPKTLTVSKEADRWHACVSCAVAPTQPLPATGQEMGIDLGIEAFATLSNGTRIFNPGWRRQAERSLKTAQRRVSQRKEGGNRRRKAVTLLARAHLKVKRRRADFHDTTARQLVQTNDTISHEDLRTTNMLKSHRLAKSIQDVGRGAFLTNVCFKAVYTGRSVAAAPPAYMTQTCSGRGVMVQTGLSVRWHACPSCGTSLHWDHNAARNRPGI
jgi:putative transposase